MGDLETARRQLDATLKRVRYAGGLTLAVGILIGGLILPLGIALAIVGLMMAVGAGFARGYYLG